MPKNKFIAGQKLICVDANGSSTLETGHCYIAQYDETPTDEIQLVGQDHPWMADRFEDFDIWASHQKPVDDKTELELTRLQVKSLQESSILLKDEAKRYLDSLREITCIVGICIKKDPSQVKLANEILVVLKNL